MIEGYPALIARDLILKHKYKSDNKKFHADIDRRESREIIIKKIKNGHLYPQFGFFIQLNGLESQLIEDPSGDSLDALLCAIQAAWAYTHRENDYGQALALAHLKGEGWIAHPAKLIIADEVTA